ncbi:hypothetical protein REPUB_Repub20aG0120300 [Reevesia pubescens]
MEEAAAAAAIVEAKGSSSGKRARPKEEVTEKLKKERDRREKMAENYDLLQSMVPNLLPKATREKIVGETIAYIESLEKEIKRLEEVKKNSSKSKEAKGKICQQQYSNKNNSSINVTVSNNVAFFGIQSLVIRPSLVTDIFMVFHKHKAEVLAANVTVNDQRQIALTVTAAVGDGNEDSTLKFENIKRDILVL